MNVYFHKSYAPSDDTLVGQHWFCCRQLLRLCKFHENGPPPYHRFTKPLFIIMILRIIFACISHMSEETCDFRMGFDYAKLDHNNLDRGIGRCERGVVFEGCFPGAFERKFRLGVALLDTETIRSPGPARLWREKPSTNGTDVRSFWNWVELRLAPVEPKPLGGGERG